MKILIVEDDRDFAKTLKGELKSAYAVDLAFLAKEGEYHAKEYDYDVIIPDIGLPDRDGIQLSGLTKQGVTSSILMLTGDSALEKKVGALDGGADDYLVKPCNSAELHARIRVLLRRKTHTIRSSMLQVGDLRLNLTDKTVTRGVKKIVLQKKEFQILEYFMRNPGKLITRGKLLEHVWESDVESVANIVDVHIKYLRDQIGKPYGKKMIKTVYGLGYKMEG